MARRIAAVEAVAEYLELYARGYRDSELAEDVVGLVIRKLEGL
jgi:hypothetical protein